MKIFKQKSPGIVTALLISTTLTLTACGGGGGGGSSGGGSDSSGLSSDNSQGTPVETSETQDLARLEIDQANELKVVSELIVEVTMTTDRSFLSICPDSGEEIDVYSLDYDDCITRSPLQANTSSFTLPLPNHVDRLVTIIWFYEGSKEPMVWHWQRDANMSYGTEALWRINEAG